MVFGIIGRLQGTTPESCAQNTHRSAGTTPYFISPEASHFLWWIRWFWAMASVFRDQTRGRTSAASALLTPVSSCQIGWCIDRVAFSSLRVDVFSPQRRRLKKILIKITNSDLIYQFFTFSLCFILVSFTWLDVRRWNPSFGHSWRRWTIDARCKTGRRWWITCSLVIVSVLRVHRKLRSTRCVRNIRVSISVAVQSLLVMLLLLLLMLLHVFCIVVAVSRRFASGSSTVIESSSATTSWSVVSRSTAWPVEPIKVSLSSKTVWRAAIEP